VGLGKSYIGAAIVSHFERTERMRPLIICPKTLEEMWERYNEVYQLNARVLSMSLLREGGEGATGSLLEDVRRELQILFGESTDVEVRDRINAVEAAFSAPVIGAVEKQLNRLSRQGVKGEELLRELEELYYRYRMYEPAPRSYAGPEEDDTPRIVCSEALT
jgi:hypothetical protein